MRESISRDNLVNSSVENDLKIKITNMHSMGVSTFLCTIYRSHICGVHNVEAYQTMGKIENLYSILALIECVALPLVGRAKKLNQMHLSCRASAGGRNIFIALT
jgi:hypothetical protein